MGWLHAEMSHLLLPGVHSQVWVGCGTSPASQEREQQKLSPLYIPSRPIETAARELLSSTFLWIKAAFGVVQTCPMNLLKNHQETVLEYALIQRWLPATSLFIALFISDSLLWIWLGGTEILFHICIRCQSFQLQRVTIAQISNCLLPCITFSSL